MENDYDPRRVGMYNPSPVQEVRAILDTNTTVYDLAWLMRECNVKPIRERKRA